MAKSVFSSFGKFISTITGPFIAVCPVCHWAPVIITAGQSTFLLAYARILRPLVIIIIVVSLLSFYLTYAEIHHNKLPLIFATLGALGIVYINYINNFGNVIFLFLGLVFFTTASLTDMNLRFYTRRKL